MTNFTKTRLTDKGLALLAKTGVSVTATKVKTGNGEYQTDADIGAMTELKSEKQEFKITSTQKKTDTTYAIITSRNTRKRKFLVFRKTLNH